MGGQIPSFINIHNPRMNTRVTVDIPPEQQSTDVGDLYRTFTRKNLIELCLESLRTIPDWNILVERELTGGRSLQIAWRVDDSVDWIWLEHDIFGNYRDWAVLCGLAFRQVCATLVRLQSLVLIGYRAVVEAAGIGYSHRPACSEPHPPQGWNSNERASSH